LPVDLNQSAIPGEVSAVSVALTMFVSVVLVNSASTDQPQISPHDEAAPLIEDLFLRLDIDPGGHVQDSHD